MDFLDCIKICWFLLTIVKELTLKKRKFFKNVKLNLSTHILYFLINFLATRHQKPLSETHFMTHFQQKEENYAKW